MWSQFCILEINRHLVVQLVQYAISSISIKIPSGYITHFMKIAIEAPISLYGPDSNVRVWLARLSEQWAWYRHLTGSIFNVSVPTVTQGVYVLEVIHTEVERDDNTCKTPLTHFTVLPPPTNKLWRCSPFSLGVTPGGRLGLRVRRPHLRQVCQLCLWSGRDQSWSHSDMDNIVCVLY